MSRPIAFFHLHMEEDPNSAEDKTRNISGKERSEDRCCPSDEEKPYNKSVAQDDSDSSVFFSSDEEDPYSVNLPEDAPASEASCKGVQEGQVDHSDVQEGAVGYSGAKKAPSTNWERLCQIMDNVNSEKDQDHEIAEYELFPREFCDAIVKVQARRKIYYFYILKSAVLESKVLEEVFVNDYVYETSACVIQPVDMYRLLDFLHYGSVTLSTLGRAKVDYKIATTYKLPRYAEFCTKYMCKNMTKDDAPEFLAFSTQNNLTELREICQNMIE